jgi:hypothetical protein
MWSAQKQAIYTAAILDRSGRTFTLCMPAPPGDGAQTQKTLQ